MNRHAAWLLLVSGALGVVTAAAGAPSRELLSLKSDEIRTALPGKSISYAPPGSADMGIREEFHSDGIWAGMLYGPGPIGFSGRWSIGGNRVCVAADRGTFATLWHPGRYCRRLWQDRKTGVLRLDYLPDQHAAPRRAGLQTLTVRDLVEIE